ncbi:RNA-directed DNA polymerase, eukaryota, partial [Tanacetum coccineum]
MVKTELFKANDSLIPFDEHLATFRGIGYSLKDKNKAKIDKTEHGIEKSTKSEFSVASVRKVIDDNRLPDVSTQTRWIKAVPIKVNVHAWKVRLDCLPTRLNISRRGIDIPSILCPICGRVTESSRHLFFDCHVAKDNFRKICRWWNVDFMEVSSFDEWSSWIVNLRMPIKHKRLLEGIMAPKKTTTPVIDAQLKTLIAQDVPDALAERDADRSRNGDDSHDLGTGSRRTEGAARECTITFRIL